MRLLHHGLLLLLLLLLIILLLVRLAVQAQQHVPHRLAHPLHHAVQHARERAVAGHRTCADGGQAGVRPNTEEPVISKSWAPRYGMYWV